MEPAAAGVQSTPALPAPSVRPATHTLPTPSATAALRASPAAALPVSTVTRVNARLVVIGSSTGGPKALQTVIEQLPANLPVPVVVAQHMPPQFTFALAKRLNETCKINVVELADNMPMQAGTVYIAPGGQHTRVSINTLKVADDKGESLYKPSVDVLAESVASVYGKQTLAVMLTGMGNDGMREFVKLHGLGAHVIAQDKDSCVVYGMPKAVVEAGGANEVLPVEAIGRRIATLLGV